MLLRNWEELPDGLRTPEVKEYYDILQNRKGNLLIKRCFDVLAASWILALLSPMMIVIAILIKKEDGGHIFYRQERVTTYGRKFRIHKFRTMVENADQIGTHVTVEDDPRITKMGNFIRKYRIDEFPQLIDVLQGTMSFVGTRPEAVKYIKAYTPEMRATLLMPAGITSVASIKYKDEAELLKNADNVDEAYINEILPEKMKYNLREVKNFNVMRDLRTMFKTVFAVLN